MFQRRTPTILLILVFAAFTAGAVYAAAPDVDVSVGFDNLFSQGRMTPVSVQVRSPDVPLDAELTVGYTAGTALEKMEHYRIRRDVSLPAGFSGVYRFQLPLKAGTYPLKVTLERNGSALAEKEVDLRHMVARGPVVVGLSRRPSLDALIPGLTNLFGRRPGLVYPRSEYLPADVRGWDGADLVIWHDLPAGDPDPAALEALAGWVAMGGTLIVFDGPWLAGGGLPAVLRPGVEGTDARSWTLGYGRVEVFNTAPADMARLPDSITAADRSFRTAAEAAAFRVADAAFRRSDPPSGPVGRHILVPAVFLLVSAGILFVRGKWLKVAALALVSLLSAGTILLLPESKFDDPEIRHLELEVAGGSGAALDFQVTRIVSPRSGTANLPVESGDVPVLPAGVDVTLRIRRDGSELEDLEIAGWRELEIIRDSLVLPGAAGRETAWRDAVLVSGGSLRLLKDWSPGTAQVQPGPVFDPADPEGPAGSMPDMYIRTLASLAEEPATTGPLILARTGETRFLVSPGDGQW